MTAPDANGPDRTELSIRPATDNDVPLLAAFARRAFETAFAADNPAEDLQLYISQSFSNDQIKKEVADHRTVFLTAWQGKHLVGYVKLCWSGPVPDCVSGPDPVQMERIYVDPGKTRMGIGAQLLAAGLKSARQRGRQCIWLGVWEHNRRAMHFYRRHGFAAVGRTPFVLGRDHQTDVVMQRPLTAR